jgi:hypothetical protein
MLLVVMVVLSFSHQNHQPLLDMVHVSYDIEVGRGWRTRILGVPHRTDYPPWAWASSRSAWRHETRRRVFQAIKDRPGWITRKASLYNRTITPLLQPTRTKLVRLPSGLYKERQRHPLVHTSYNTTQCKASRQTRCKVLRYHSGMN